MISSALFWFFVALAFALFEVENEGKYGWSSASQTWFIFSERLPGIVRKFFNKPLTGYHIFILLSAFLISHMHFFMGVKWTWVNEFRTLAIYLAWTPLWDYLWLVFNPNYGVKFLGTNKIWWYKKSIWIFKLVPIENLVQWGISIFFAYLGGVLVSHLIFLGLLSLLTIVSAFTLAPVYQKWNRAMHINDDRDGEKMIDWDTLTHP